MEKDFMDLIAKLSKNKSGMGFRFITADDKGNIVKRFVSKEDLEISNVQDAFADKAKKFCDIGIALIRDMKARHVLLALKESYVTALEQYPAKSHEEYDFIIKAACDAIGFSWFATFLEFQIFNESHAMYLEYTNKELVTSTVANGLIVSFPNMEPRTLPFPKEEVVAMTKAFAESFDSDLSDLAKFGDTADSSNKEINERHQHLTECMRRLSRFIKIAVNQFENGDPGNDGGLKMFCETGSFALIPAFHDLITSLIKGE